MEKGKDKGKRRASSERRHKWPDDRSRSPDPLQADIRIEVAERAINAPVFVEPGLDGDELGVEGRHRNNMLSLFGFVEHVEKVLNNHADLLDGTDLELRVQRRSARAQALEVKALKAEAEEMNGMKKHLDKTEEEMKQILIMMEASVAQSNTGIWDFPQANDEGVMMMSTDADAAVNKLNRLVEEAANDTAAARSLQPSAIASGPPGLAFMRLRSGLTTLEETVGAQSSELQNDLNDVNAAMDVATVAAGAAPRAPPGIHGDAMQELEKLEEAWKSGSL
jgi:hypothetical protein